MHVWVPSQDLSRTRLILWADNPATIVNSDTRPFFTAFSENIIVRRFDYAAEVVGTPLGGHAYFGSAAAIKASLPAERGMAVFSDLVRYLLLHKYGGLWCARRIVAALQCASMLAMLVCY